MGYIHADTALSDLTNGLSYDYEIGNVTDDDVEVFITKDDIQVCVWFSCDKQMYGFNLQNGGSKSFRTVDNLIEAVDVYMNVLTVLLPHAKMVADTFEEEVGIKTVYNRFVGRKDTGYTFIFPQVGEPSHGIRVQALDQSGVIFNALYVEYYSQDTGMVRGYNPKVERNYTIQDGIVKDVSNTLLLDSLVCENAVLSDDGQYLTYKDDKCFFVLTIDDNQYKYVKGNVGVHKVIEEGYITSRDSLDSIVEEFKSNAITESIELINLINSSLSYNEYNTLDSDVSIDIQLEYLGIDGVRYPLRSIEDVLYINDICIETEEDFKVFLSRYCKKKYKKPEVLDINNLVQEQSNSIKLMTGENNEKFVRFSNKDGIFDISVGVAKKLGVPLSRIVETDELFMRNGILMSNEELRLKKFAINISDDMELCEKLIESLFM